MTVLMSNTMTDRNPIFTPAKPVSRFFALLAALAVSSAVAAGVDDINKEIDSCSGKHGYDPRQSSQIDANKLGENERAFLDCVYSGIESNLVPKAMFPKDYKYLVQRYREMTDAVEKGELTRADRTAETQQIINIMKDKEVKETNKRIDDLSSKREWLIRQRENMVRGASRGTRL